MKQKIFLPMVIVQLYLSISLLLFEFGPIRYNKTGKEAAMVTLVIIYQISLLAGYIIAGRKKDISTSNELIAHLYHEGKVNLVISLALMLCVIFSTASFVRYVGNFSLSSWYYSIINGFRSSGEAYLYSMTVNSSSIFTKLSTLFVGFYYVGIPLGVYFYRSLNSFNRILLPIAILLEIGSYIIRGTNIGIFRVILSIACIIFIKGEIKIEKKKKIFIIIAIVFFMYYFTTSVASRMGGTIIPRSLFGISIDFSMGIGQIIPTSLRYTFLSITSYISQGYNGMMLALDRSFTSSYGIGNSIFLLENMPFINSDSIYQRTYIYKISDAWSDRINWSTAYTWFANDIGFIGVIILMFILGFMFRKVVNNVLERDIYAILLIPLYIQLFLFLPCNNSLLSNPNTFMPFVFLHFIWFLKSKRVYIRAGSIKIWNKDMFRI